MRISSEVRKQALTSRSDHRVPGSTPPARMSGEEADAAQPHARHRRVASSEESAPPKRTQNCSFCKNHKLKVPKKGHICRFKNCRCYLCELTRTAQTMMRHQQRFWRHQKFRLQPTNALPEKGQLCDMCRNHNELILKKNHQCEYAKCTCQYCTLTHRRRRVMKCLQRVRRKDMTSNTDLEAGRQMTSQRTDFSPGNETKDSDDSSTWHPDPADSKTNNIDDNVGPSPQTTLTSACSYEQDHESEIEDTHSPSPSDAISSPPPLIPLSVISQDDAIIVGNAVSCGTEYVTDAQRHQQCLPASTLYPQEENIMQVSTPILSGLGRHTPEYYRQPEVSPWNEPLSLCKPLPPQQQKFVGYPEQYRNHHVTSSSSVVYSHFVDNASESRPRVPLAPERSTPTYFHHAPVSSLPMGEGGFIRQVVPNRMMMSPFVAPRHIHQHGLDAQEYVYYEQNRLN